MKQLVLLTQNPQTDSTLRNILISEGIPSDITVVDSQELLMGRLRQNDVDLVVLETDTNHSKYLKLLQNIKLFYPSTPVLMLSLDNTRAFAIQAMRLNAHGFLTCETIVEELADAVKSIYLGRCYMTTALTA